MAMKAVEPIPGPATVISRLSQTGLAHLNIPESELDSLSAVLGNDPALVLAPRPTCSLTPSDPEAERRGVDAVPPSA